MNCLFFILFLVLILAQIYLQIRITWSYWFYVFECLLFCIGLAKHHNVYTTLFFSTMRECPPCLKTHNFPSLLLATLHFRSLCACYSIQFNTLFHLWTDRGRLLSMRVVFLFLHWIDIYASIFFFVYTKSTYL